MAGSAELFSLRWNDFHSNLSQSFHALLEEKHLVDVTLAAGGQFLYAHKLILSVSSPYFKELFETNPCEHPVVILKDVRLHEMKQILQFMYRGEVHVREQELSGFLHTAEMLQVKGLTQGRERSESPSTVEECPTKPEPAEVYEWVPGGEDTIATEAPPAPRDEARSPLKRLLKTRPTKSNVAGTKKKPRPATENPVPATENPVPATDNPVPANERNDSASDSDALLDFDIAIYNLGMTENAKEPGWNGKSNGAKCDLCHRYFANRYNLKVHKRDKHEPPDGKLQCEICFKQMRNHSCLRVHKYNHRKQAAQLRQLVHPENYAPDVGDKSWHAEGPYGPMDYNINPDAFQPPMPMPDAEAPSETQPDAETA